MGSSRYVRCAAIALLDVRHPARLRRLNSSSLFSAGPAVHFFSSLLSYAAMTSLLHRAAHSPSPYAPSPLCCPPTNDDDTFGGAATKEAATAGASAAQAEKEKGVSARLAELTMESPCIPLGIACADSAKSAGEACAASSVATPTPLPADRLAAVNSFTLNPEEPKRGMQELVHALMQELEGGQNKHNTRREVNRFPHACATFNCSLSSCAWPPPFVSLPRQEGFESSVQHHDVVRCVRQRVEEI